MVEQNEQDDEAPPRVVAHVVEVENWRPSQLGARYLFKVRCPYCGKLHTHGADTVRAEIPARAGHRIGHCADYLDRRRRQYVSRHEQRWRGYILVLADDWQLALDGDAVREG